MKILLYTLNYAPELIGIGKYNTEMCEWLLKKGHQIKVIAAHPYYPEWKIKNGYKSFRYKKENRNKILLVRCPIFVKRNISSVFRLFHLLSFTISSFPILGKEIIRFQPDITILTEPPFMCSFSTILFCRLFGIKTWLHIQDFEIHAAFDTKLISITFLKKLVMSMEKFLLNQFNVVSSISENMVEQLKIKGLTRPLIVKLQNWVDTKEFYPNFTIEKIKDCWGIKSDEIMVLYSGNMGHKQGVDLIIEVAKVMLERKKYHIKFILCGDGAMKKKIERQSLELQNIKLLPVQTKEKYKELLNTADIHLIPQRSDINDNVMPSKLSTILSCGGVVIATANPGTEVDRVVKGAGGIVCDPKDVTGFAEAIIELSSKNKDILEKSKNKARKYALCHFEKNQILNSFNEVLSSI
jgi:colanic acid biosynthesis glycosyl transferase WcaI